MSTIPMKNPTINSANITAFLSSFCPYSTVIIMCKINATNDITLAAINTNMVKATAPAPSPVRILVMFVILPAKPAVKLAAAAAIKNIE